MKKISLFLILIFCIFPVFSDLSSDDSHNIASALDDTHAHMMNPNNGKLASGDIYIAVDRAAGYTKSMDGNFCKTNWDTWETDPDFEDHSDCRNPDYLVSHVGGDETAIECYKSSSGGILICEANKHVPKATPVKYNIRGTPIGNYDSKETSRRDEFIYNFYTPGVYPSGTSFTRDVYIFDEYVIKESDLGYDSIDDFDHMVICGFKTDGTSVDTNLQLDYDGMIYSPETITDPGNCNNGLVVSKSDLTDEKLKVVLPGRSFDYSSSDSLTFYFAVVDYNGVSDFDDGQFSSAKFLAKEKEINLETNDLVITAEEDKSLSLFRGEELCPNSLYFEEKNSNEIISCPYESISELNGDYFSCVVNEDNFYGEVNKTIICSDSVSEIEANLNITISNIDDPVCVDTSNPESYTIREDSTITQRFQAISNLDNIDVSNSLQINSGPSDGTLTTQFTVSEGLTFTYTPNEDYIGYDSFTYTLSGIDSAACGELEGTYSQSGTISLTIQNTNDAPFAQDSYIELDEDTEYSFTEFDFPFSDPSDEDEFSSIKIYSLPNYRDGKLYYNNKPARLYQEIPISNTGTGNINNLVFVPTADKFGENLAKFLFKVKDSGGLFSNELSELSINVYPVQDKPSISLRQSSITIEEDTQKIINFNANDIDGDELTFYVSSSNNDIINEDKIELTGGNGRYRLKLSPEPNKYTRIIEENLNNPVIITIDVEDEYFEFDSKELSVVITPVNDKPFSENFSLSNYYYLETIFQEDWFLIQDVDGDSISSIQIMGSNSGELRYDGTKFTGLKDIKLSDINKLSFSQTNDVSEDTSDIESVIFFRIVDENGLISDKYNITINYEVVPFGIYARPANYYFKQTGMLGNTIPNLEYGSWVCIQGYQPILESVSNKYSCELIPNEPPIANFSVIPLFENTSYAGTDLTITSTSNDPDGFTTGLTHNWSINESNEKIIVLRNFNGSICDSQNICSITLNVTDEDGDSSSITKTFLFSSEEDKEKTDESKNLANKRETLTINKGQTYSDAELAILGLSKGGSTVKDGTRILVDNNGTITKFESLLSRTADTDYDDPSTNFEIGDGYCDKFRSENSVNSPRDCKESSGLLGIIIVFSFISILGILGFVAWKKGLFSKLGSSKKSIAKPATYDAPSYTAPANNSAAPTSNFLSKMIKEKIDQGYSEGEIKSYLISKGYSESEIDNAINS